MNTYAVMNGNTIVNLVICASAAYAAAQGWILVTPGPTVQIGSTTSNGGVSWTPPAAPATITNDLTIQSNLLAQLATIETWITNNPTGAVLNAAQTLNVAQMLAGIVRTLLSQFSTVGGS